HPRLLLLERRSYLCPELKYPELFSLGPREWLRNPTHGGGTLGTLGSCNQYRRLACKCPTGISSTPTTASTPSLDMASSRHLGAITELNLGTCQPNTLV